MNREDLKRTLKDQTCSTCRHTQIKSTKEGKWKIVGCTVDGRVDPLPETLTCPKWEKVGPLKVKWTRTSELLMDPSIAAEIELAVKYAERKRKKTT